MQNLSKILKLDKNIIMEFFVFSILSSIVMLIGYLELETGLILIISFALAYFLYFLMNTSRKLNNYLMNNKVVLISLPVIFSFLFSIMFFTLSIEIVDYVGIISIIFFILWAITQPYFLLIPVNNFAEKFILFIRKKTSKWAIGIFFLFFSILSVSYLSMFFAIYIINLEKLSLFIYILLTIILPIMVLLIFIVVSKSILKRLEILSYTSIIYIALGLYIIFRAQAISKQLETYGFFQGLLDFLLVIATVILAAFSILRKIRSFRDTLFFRSFNVQYLAFSLGFLYEAGVIYLIKGIFENPKIVSILNNTLSYLGALALIYLSPYLFAVSSGLLIPKIVPKALVDFTFPTEKNSEFPRGNEIENSNLND